MLRYDNLGSAVKKVLRGYRREETSRFIAFRSHWHFQSEFCNPARGNEKGGIEGEGGYFRRNHWVPLPEFGDLEQLNNYLETCCREDQRRVLAGRSETVGAAMLHEQPYLLPLAAEPFELAETSFPTVDGFRCVRVRTNRYSVPLPPGTKVEAKVQADTVELWHQGKRVARHERCYNRQQQILDLEHYLDVLRKKPGALAGSTPLAQWRQAGRWPECLDRLWQALIARHGRQQGTRQMIELLSLGTAQGWEKLRAAVEQALSLGCHEVGYVPMAELGAEFLFQVIAERAEKAAVILTTNLPFSEWTQVIPNARLCKALLDRITDRAHIIETGSDSYRFRRTVEKSKTKPTG